jgi:hypothetical protein
VAPRVCLYRVVAVTTRFHWSAVAWCIVLYLMAVFSNVLWEQDVGGSNPLAPTKLLDRLYEMHVVGVVATHVTPEQYSLIPFPNIRWLAQVG